jgi:hypothetical protein
MKSFMRFIIDMHGAESNVSWMRWIGTMIIANVMIVWTLNCIFDEQMHFCFTLEDIPLNLAGIIGMVILGKVGQAYTDKKSIR